MARTLPSKSITPTGDDIRTKNDYVDFYSNLNNFTIKESYVQYDAFSSAVIYNNYEEFAKKVVHYINFYKANDLFVLCTSHGLTLGLIVN